MSNAKRRHRRRRRVQKHARMLEAIRFAALGAVDWIDRDLGDRWGYVGWLQVRPLGSES